MSENVTNTEQNITEEKEEVSIPKNENTAPQDEAFEIPGKNRKGSKLPVIAAILTALIIIAVVSAIVVSQFVIKPASQAKNRVLKAYEDFDARQTVYDHLLDDATLDMLLDDGADLKGTVQIKSNTLLPYINGFGAGFDGAYSAKDNIASADCSLKYNGMDMLPFKGSCTKKVSTLFLNDAMKESFSIHNANVVSQITKVPAIGEFFVDMEEFSFMPFNYIDMARSSRALSKKTEELSKAAAQRAIESFSYEKAGKSEAPDGTMYDAYTAVLSEKNAKDIALEYLNAIKDSEEYSEAVKNGTGIFYTAADAEKGDLTPIITEIENADFDEIRVTLIPLDNGLRFSADQDISGYAFKMTGSYDSMMHELSLQISIERSGSVTKIYYNDHIATTDGIMTDKRELTVDTDGVASYIYYNAEYEIATNKLDLKVESSDGSAVIKAEYSGTVIKGEKMLEISADSFKVSDQNGEIITLGGNITASERTIEPQMAYGDTNIYIDQIDLLQLINLYGEMKENDSIKQLLDILKMF